MRDYLKVYYQVLQDNRLTTNDKLIYSYIRSFQDNNRLFYNSNNVIAKRLGMSKSTVLRSLEHLKELQLIHIEYETKQGPSTTNKVSTGPKTSRIVLKNRPKSELIDLWNEVFKDKKIDKPN